MSEQEELEQQQREADEQLKQDKKDGTAGFKTFLSDAPVAETKDSEKKPDEEVKTGDKKPVPGEKKELSEEEQAAADETARIHRKGEKTRTRISKLVEERNTAQDKGAEETHRADLAEARLKKILSGDAPNRDDYASNEDFLKAIDEGVKVKPAKKVSEGERNYNAARDLLFEAFEETREKYDDFDELVTSENAKSKPSTTMVMVASELELPGEVFYFLGKNTEESERIAKLSPTATMKAMLAIEAEIKDGEKEPPKKVTNAPDPLKNPLSGTQAKGGKDLEEQTVSEFNATRDAQEQEGKKGFWN